MGTVPFFSSTFKSTWHVFFKMAIKIYEIQSFYGKQWAELLYEWYVTKKMSSPEIAEKVRQDTGIDYTDRAVHLWAYKLGFSRTQSESMKNRVLRGRMNYSDRKINYESRFIDYDDRERKLGHLWAVGLRKHLRKEGSQTRLAKKMGMEDGSSISGWCNLRRRVSPEYQDKICAYFGVDRSDIFSEIKAFDVSKIGTGASINQRKRLIKNEYRYVINLRDVIYKREITIQDLSSRLNKPFTTISGWIQGKKLVSPADQARLCVVLGGGKELNFASSRKGARHK